MTEPERRLWQRLRELKDLGLHFRRQAPIGPFIVDFVLFSKKLVIELDGDTHGSKEQQSSDMTRTQFLVGNGFRVIRFSNADVMACVEAVGTAILHAANTPETLTNIADLSS